MKIFFLNMLKHFVFGLALVLMSSFFVWLIYLNVYIGVGLFTLTLISILALSDTLYK